MKKLLLLNLLVLSVVALPSTAYAHYNGQPIFKIDGIYVKVNPGAVAQEELDIAPEDYSVDQLLNFELDTSRLPSPKSVFDKTDFIWNFGDGSPEQKTSGVPKISYAFTASGTYTLSVMADYKPAGFNYPPQSLDKVKIAVSKDANGVGKSASSSKFLVPLVVILVALLPLLIVRLRSNK